MDDFKDIPHHDSGYFPGMNNRLAWVVLVSLVFAIVGIVYAITRV